MTGRGRPYIGRTIEARVEDDVRAALDAAAVRRGVPLAALIRDILTEWFNGDRR